MKTAEAKHTTSPHSHNSGEPFFQKNGDGAFFSGSQTDLQTKPFFSKQETTPFIQTKLTIARQGDQYEQEADAVADRVVQRLSNPETVQTKPMPLASTVTPFVQPKCVGCEEEEQIQKKEEEEDRLENGIQRKPVFESDEPPPEEEEIQRKCTECLSAEALAKESETEEKLQKKGEAGSSETGSSPSLESRLSSSRGSGSRLPAGTRTQMESSFGADFSNVRVHTGSSAVQMNKDLHAQAFTHGSDIYFNSGKYDPESTEGKHLLAHELTHTVQQGGAGLSATAQTSIQRWPEWVSDAAGWVSDTASDVAGGVVEGAELVGGHIKDGVELVGGMVASAGEALGDQVGAAVEWIIDRIRSVIDSGTNYLNEKWESIQNFGRTCFEDIKNGFGGLIHFVTAPLSSFMTALSVMNADTLQNIWNLVTSGSNALWLGINAVINSVLQIGEGIWNTVSGFMEGVFNTVSGLFNNAAFRQLPNWLQEEARSLFNGLQSLWNRVSSFWADLWQRLTSTIQEILAAVRSFADNVIGYAIDKVIAMVRGLKEVYDYVMNFFADPQATIQPFLDHIAAKLNAEVPGRANNLGARMAQENYTGGAAQTTDNGSIQKQGLEDSEDRTTATLYEVFKGIVYYIAQAWADLDIGKMLWQTVVNMFWPPATIRAIVAQFSQLWNDDWATTVDSLYAPRNFFDNPIGCLHDIWSNYLILLDFPLSVWRTLNNVIGLLMGYVTIIVVLVEGIGGAIAGSAAGGVGALPGFFAGAAAGLVTMVPLGQALMASYLLAEGSTVYVILVRLFTARQLCEKRQIDILTSVASFIAMAVAIVLAVLMALLAELVSLIANAIRGVPKTAPVPEPTPRPLPEPAPRPVPEPVPARPVPAQPIPSQPVVPGDGNVIPFPSQPAPVTPAVPEKIAAKFEEGESQVSLDALSDDKSQESTQDMETMPLSEVHVFKDGVLQAKQTSRKEKINPDACEPRKNICYERSVTFNINRTSMNFIGIQPTPDDLRIAACLLRTATGTTVRDFKSLNVAIGKFLVNNSFEYIPGVNISGGNIHSEDIILIEANRIWGAGNYKLAALFSERVPCPRCKPNLRGTPLTPDARIYCIINNDYNWSSIRRSYNDGRLV